VVLTNGAVSNSVVGSGGNEFEFGGLARSNSVASGGVDVVSAAGRTVGLTLLGGTQYVYSGATAYGTTVSGGLQAVAAQGIASGTKLLGGSQTVAVAASALATSVGAGGLQTLLAGGGTSGTIVSAGGTQDLGYHGRASATVLSGGMQTIESGGHGSETSVGVGGVQIVSSGGDSYSTTISSGGVEVVQSGGSATYTTVSGGGLLAVLAGGMDQVPTNAGGFVVGGAAVVLLTASGATGFGPNVAGATVAAGSTLYVFSGGTAAVTKVASGGSVVALGGFVTNTTISGGALTVAAGAHAAGYVKFATGGGALSVLGHTLPGATIGGFGAGDTIYLPDVAWVAGGTVTWNSVTGALSIQEGGVSAALGLDATHSYGGDVFSATADAAGGTEITVTCFCAGTKIATPDGDVAVELLRAGDPVRLADGRDVPVRWVGRQTISRRFADPLRALPIRIRAGALDGKLPRRDLMVSPGHALLLDGMLVQAGALAKQSGISREYAMPDKFVYYHVELDEHALLLAEGVAVESYVEGVEAFGFDNRHERSVAVAAPEMDLPRIKAARQVPERLRARLGRRAVA